MPATDVVTCSSLGKRGRFSNQVLQYMYAWSYARDVGCELRTWPWIGQRLFGFADRAIDVYLPVAPGLPYPRPHPDAFVPAAARTPNVDLYGTFLGSVRPFSAHREELLRRFTPVPAARALLKEQLESVRRRGRTLVGVHVRRGDFGYEHNYLTPADWYLRWLEAHREALPDPVVYVATDDPRGVLPAFAAWRPVSAADLGPGVPGVGFATDYFVLSRCDVLLGSNSTFSFTAAMLNPGGGEFHRPSLRTRDFVRFDPWSDPPLLWDRLEDHPEIRGLRPGRAARWRAGLGRIGRHLTAADARIAAGLAAHRAGAHALAARLLAPPWPEEDGRRRRSVVGYARALHAQGKLAEALPHMFEACAYWNRTRRDHSALAECLAHGGWHARAAQEFEAAKG